MDVRPARTCETVRSELYLKSAVQLCALNQSFCSMSMRSFKES